MDGGLVHLTVLFASSKQEKLMTLLHMKPLTTSVLCYCMNERCACKISFVKQLAAEECISSIRITVARSH